MNKEANKASGKLWESFKREVTDMFSELQYELRHDEPGVDSNAELSRQVEALRKKAKARLESGEMSAKEFHDRILKKMSAKK